jgi:hypothetical protein
LYRTAAPWIVVAAAALLWPARVIGSLDGIPLDSGLEAIAIGWLFPLLCWLSPQFLLSRVARGLVVALLALKVGGALVLTQQGWCERLITPAPLNQDANQTQLAWDARADWRSAVPRCSAILARPYADLVSFPVWFLNLAGPSGRPPDAFVAMTVDGFLSTFVCRHVFSLAVGGAAASRHDRRCCRRRRGAADVDVERRSPSAAVDRVSRRALAVCSVVERRESLFIRSYDDDKADRRRPDPFSAGADGVRVVGSDASSRLGGRDGHGARAWRAGDDVGRGRIGGDVQRRRRRRS